MLLRIGFALLFLVYTCDCSHLRGMSISWKPTYQNRTVDIIFRSSWRRSYSRHFCSNTEINSGQLIGETENITCVVGCSGIVSDTRYQCTDFSVSDDYSSGVRTVSYTFPPTNDLFYKFEFDDCCWLRAVGSGSWKIRAIANLTVRPDTGLINSPPVTAMQAFVKLQTGCLHTIQIPVFDADSDDIRCRWAESSMDECASVCKQLPDAVLFEENCTISYQASNSTGMYVVAVQIEDFGHLSSAALSSVPLQFLVQLVSSSSCGDEPELISPSPEDGTCIGVSSNTQYFQTIAARGISPSRSVTSINTVSPVGMTKTSLQPYQGSGIDKHVNVTWTPLPSQAGPNIFCFAAMDSSSSQSNQRCITIYVDGDIPSVVPNSLSPRGMIRPSHNTWSLEFDSQFQRPTATSFINFYLSNGTLVYQIDASTSPNITYPNTPENRTISFTTDFAFTEFEEYYILLDAGIAQSTSCSIMSEPVTDTEFWKVNIDGDSCLSGRNNCSANTRCTDHFGGFTCICNDGFSRDGLVCTDINECSIGTSRCSQFADCSNTIGSYICTCTLGFQGNGFNCSDINECTSSQHTCNNQANCENIRGSYTCTCITGYTGNGVSCTDVNECARGISNCSSFANCKNTPGSYICTCKSGFHGNGIHCNDTNECTSGQHNCSNQANCDNIRGSFKCTCISGYTGDGVSCIDINECDNGANNCHNLADCGNTPGSYNCTCRSGYHGNGSSCSDINECNTGQNNCNRLATCSNIPGSYRCTCVNGYTGNGVLCTDINECSGNNDCNQFANCSNTVGSYSCKCKTGYHGNGVDCYATMTTITPTNTQSKFPLILTVDATLPNKLTGVYTREYQAVLSEMKNALKQLFQRRLGNRFVDVEITSIRERPVIVENAVIATGNGAQEAVYDVAEDLTMGKEFIMYAGAMRKVSSARINYMGHQQLIFRNNVSRYSCELFESLKKCDLRERCEMTDNKPRCFPVPKNNSLNLGYVLAFIGIFPMLACLAGIAFIIVRFIYENNMAAIRREERKSKHQIGSYDYPQSIFYVPSMRRKSGSKNVPPQIATI